MITVLTLTYKRKHLLEEAIQSFLEQYHTGTDEMIIINDNIDCDYFIDNERVKIFNVKQRFHSIAAKIEWGYKQASNDYIYRLDDDDLLAKDGLHNAKTAINSTSIEYDIYRSNSHYFFSENKFVKISDSINNGNIYNKNYLNNIEFPDLSGDEDANITFHHGASIFTFDKPTMIYRWGMNTLHISGMGKQTSEVILREADAVLMNERGRIELQPKFLNDYYGQIK